MVLTQGQVRRIAAMRSRGVDPGEALEAVLDSPETPRNRFDILLDEAVARGELVQSRATGLWMMGPYTSKNAASVFRAAGGLRRKTNAEQAAEAKARAEHLATAEHVARLAREAGRLGLRIPKRDFEALVRQRPDAIRRLEDRIAAAQG